MKFSHFACVCPIAFLIYELVFNSCMTFVLKKIHLIYILRTLYSFNCESCILSTNSTVHLKLIHIYFISICIVLMNWIIIMYIQPVECTERLWKSCQHCTYYTYSLKIAIQKLKLIVGLLYYCSLVFWFERVKWLFFSWCGVSMLFSKCLCPLVV